MRTRIRALTRGRWGRPIVPVRWRGLPSRRQVVETLVRLPLLAGLATSGLATLGVVVPGGRPLAARRPSRFDMHAESTIAAVLDRMLPGDELPGAVALGIDRRILAMENIALKQSLSDGVAWLDGRARRKKAADFLALDDAGRDAVLEAALASRAAAAGAISGSLRNLALTLYYTHPTVMAAFAYSGPPQPAGFPDFEDAPR